MNKDGKEEKVRNRELAGGSVEVIGDQALCQCSNGSAQIPLKVTSQQKFYCNSASRLIATNGDKDGSSLNFGNCKARNNSPCMPLIQWKYFYDKILISDKLFPLTMRSEGDVPLWRCRLVRHLGATSRGKSAPLRCRSQTNCTYKSPL